MNILLDSFHPAEPYYYMCNPIPKKRVLLLETIV